MSTPCVQLDRRPAGPADDGYLRTLFAHSRDDLLLLPADVRETLLDMQVRAQRRQVEQDFPNARYEVLVVDGADAGLIVTADVEDVRHVVDVVVERARRGDGIGTAALRAVLAEAGGQRVRLQVWSGNARARGLYERLGFVAIDGADEVGHITMEHKAVRV